MFIVAESVARPSIIQSRVQRKPGYTQAVPSSLCSRAERLAAAGPVAGQAASEGTLAGWG